MRSPETRKKISKSRSWKDKTLDYEIETVAGRHPQMENNDTWKDKTLDYEIETHRILLDCTASRLLEKIRLSITRLKRNRDTLDTPLLANLKR